MAFAEAVGAVNVNVTPLGQHEVGGITTVGRAPPHPKVLLKTVPIPPQPSSAVASKTKSVTLAPVKVKVLPAGDESDVTPVAPQGFQFHCWAVTLYVQLELLITSRSDWQKTWVEKPNPIRVTPYKIIFFIFYVFFKLNYKHKNNIDKNKPSVKKWQLECNFYSLNNFSECNLFQKL